MQHFFQFQNNLVQASKDRRSAVHDPSPFKIKVSVPCFDHLAVSLYKVDVKIAIEHGQKKFFFRVRAGNTQANTDNHHRKCALV